MQTNITTRELEMLFWLTAHCGSGVLFSTLESSEYGRVPEFPEAVCSFATHSVSFNGFEFLVDIPFRKHEAAVEHVERHRNTNFHEALDELMVDLCEAPLPARIPMGDLRGLKANDYQMLLELRIHEAIYPLVGIPPRAPAGEERDWHIGVHCNDTFYWASSDSEYVPLDQLSMLYEAHKRWGRNGTAAMVSFRRGWHEPIPPANTEQFQQACEWLKTWKPQDDNPTSSEAG